MDGPSLLFLHLLIIQIPIVVLFLGQELSLPICFTALLGKVVKARQGAGLPSFIFWIFNIHYKSISWELSPQEGTLALSLHFSFQSRLPG